MKENNIKLEDDEISSFKKIINSKKADSIIPITIIDIVMGLLAFLCLFTFSFLLLYDTDTNSMQSIIIAFIECGFVFIGIFFLTFNFYKITNKEKLVNLFQKDSDLTFFGFAVLFGGGILISIITGNFEILSTISIIDLLIVFSAIAEEMFFRGFLITYFNNLYLAFKINEKKIWLKYIYIALIIGFTSYLFTIIHVNRYEDFPLLIEVFVVGILLGTYYWVTKDLTACILAHLLRNIAAIRDLALFISGIIFIALTLFILMKKNSNY